jgi:PAS domain S-box-containing protein
LTPAEGASALRAPLFEFHDGAGSSAPSLTQGHDALRREVERLGGLNATMHRMLDALEVGVVAVDRNGRVGTMNRTAEKLLGVDLDRCRGKLYHALKTGFASPPRIVRHMRSGRAPEPERRRLRLQDGREITVESSVSLLRSDQGDIVGAINTLKDITAFEELERASASRARRASIGRLASRLDRDIRNPLTAIAGYSELLAADMPAEDPRKRFAECIVWAVAALDRAMGSALVFAERPKLTRQEADASKLLREAADLIQEDIAAEGRAKHAVVVETGLSSATARLDVEQIKHALLNLGKNGLEAMPRGGTLTLRLGVAPGATAETPRIRFSAIDQGRGIDPARCDALFEPFETTKPDAAGLGLAVVRKIAELHDGSVSVESAKGRATAFHLDLPAVCVSARLAPEDACESASAVRRPSGA